MLAEYYDDFVEEQEIYRREWVVLAFDKYLHEHDVQLKDAVGHLRAFMDQSGIDPCRSQYRSQVMQNLRVFLKWVCDREGVEYDEYAGSSDGTVFMLHRDGTFCEVDKNVD